MYKKEITRSPNSQNGFPKAGDTDRNDTETHSVIGSVAAARRLLQRKFAFLTLCYLLRGKRKNKKSGEVIHCRT